MKNLIIPTPKYIEKVENSRNYLNCPKHMINHDVDCLYRQGIVIDRETAVRYISGYLKYYGITNPTDTATKFVEWRSTITIREFNKINVNSYIEKTPKHIDHKHRRINQWIDDNTTYHSAIYGGGVNTVPSYPFKYG